MQIKFNNVSFLYNHKSELEVKTLDNINIDLSDNDITAIAGETGSGKSTLTELINKLLTPTFGEVYIDNLINSKNKKVRYKELKKYRCNVGFLFQNSENQLFEESVLKDVLFGLNSFYPKNNNNEELAKTALKLVGLNESFYNRSPLDLSGGEKKKVAIAGIIAYRPKLLILDEPTAGLDAKGVKDLMDLFLKIHNEMNTEIILVTHDMDLVLKYVNKMIILDKGIIKCVGNPKDVLLNNVEQYHLDTPNIYKVINALKEKGRNLNIDRITDIPSLVREIKENGN